MAVKAFILIESTNAKARMAEVVTALEKVAGIKWVEPIGGHYDFIALVQKAIVQKPNTYAIGGVVTDIQSVSGIGRTMTCIAPGFR